MKNSTKYKKRPPAGQEYCEKCGKLVLDWTISTIMIDGIFYDICRSCKAELKPKQ